jgi:transposase
VLLTNRMDWTAEQVVAGYDGQRHIEKVFRGLKDGDWLGWGPMYHWTDDKIRVHAFYCMLGISLLQYIHKQVQAVWPGLSTEQLIEQLEEIQQFTLLYPPQGEKGPNRVAKVVSKQTLRAAEPGRCTRSGSPVVVPSLGNTRHLSPTQTQLSWLQLCAPLRQ